MDLTTRYLGLALKNPLVASASPLNADVGNLRRLEDAGAAAVVLPSLFEEDIAAETARWERLAGASAESVAEARSFFPEVARPDAGPQYLDLVRRARAAIDIPVIASLNGTTDAGWIAYARAIEAAGAAALELNVHFVPADLAMTGAAVEQRYLDIVRHVRATVAIPVAVKVGPYFSAVGHMAHALADAGADGLVLFNRFYQPDVDLVRLALTPDLGLSEPHEIRLPLLWLALLSGRVRASLAATSGVATADEVVKYLLVGADVVMTTSALLRHGVGHMGVLLAGLEAWLAARRFGSVDQVRGLMSQRNLRDPSAFERANYVATVRGRRP
jgi:dihydroorotate dehydrogenase (fumarate)